MQPGEKVSSEKARGEFRFNNLYSSQRNTKYFQIVRIMPSAAGCLILSRPNSLFPPLNRYTQFQSKIYNKTRNDTVALPVVFPYLIVFNLLRLISRDSREFILYSGLVRRKNPSYTLMGMSLYTLRRIMYLPKFQEISSTKIQIRSLHFLAYFLCFRGGKVILEINFIRLPPKPASLNLSRLFVFRSCPSLRIILK